ncbi:MAG TPA: 4-oxalocrotonate tautomerase [Lactobacillus sp.]|nr:4-oxalocrotonate tautomerase [Lactobacillus sp.]
MPYLRVRIASHKNSVSSQEVANTLTNLAVKVLGKAQEAVAVDVHFSDPADWFIAGKSLTSRKQTSFFVEIKITEATNNRDEKAEFVKETFAEMARLFPDVAETSYVVLQDVASEAWGYGGKTQEFRYISDKVK